MIRKDKQETGETLLLLGHSNISEADVFTSTLWTMCHDLR